MEAFKNWLHEMPKWAFIGLQVAYLFFVACAIYFYKPAFGSWVVFVALIVICHILIMLSGKIPPSRNNGEWD